MNILKKLLLISFVGLLLGCDNQLLLSNLSQRQSNEVLAILQEHGVEAQRKHDNKNRGLHPSLPRQLRDCCRLIAPV